jgi:glycosyltransferase involved in cell wall biosynthesis
MKVLLVTPSYFPIIGGSEVLTRGLSIKLNELGIKTDIMTFNMNDKWNPVWMEKTEKEGSVYVFRMPALTLFRGVPNPLYPLLRMNVLPKLSFIRKLGEYDIIHFISEADLSFPILSYFIKKPKVFQCCGLFPNGGIYRYYTFLHPNLGILFRKIFPHLACSFLFQSAAEPELLEGLGVPSNKTFMLPHSVDVDAFIPDETKKRENLLLFVGRIDRIKGLHLLMEALPYIDIPTSLAVIGPRMDEEYAREINLMAHAINEKGFHKVEFIGPMDQMDLISWYQKAAILVCPYIFETFSFVVLEALACGTPVVSTGMHILEKGSDGITLTSQNAEELAFAITKLLKDHETRKRLGKEGRNVVTELFSWNAIVKILVDFYESILHSQNTHRS